MNCGPPCCAGSNRQGSGRGKQALHQLAHAAYLVTEGQAACTAEEQAFFHIATQRSGQLVVDAELAPARSTIAKAALAQAVKAFGAAALRVRHGL